MVNYNRHDLTTATVASVLAQDGGGSLHPVVIDSASSSTDRDCLRTELPKGVPLRALADNRGYGAACNAAISMAISKGIPYVWLLNNDIAIEPGCIRYLVAALEDDPSLAAVAPTIVQYDRPDMVLSNGVRVGLRFGRLVHHSFGMSTRSLPQGPERVDALEASALLMRVSSARQCGGFDEAFFMYWEDTDWSLRARENGWELASCPQARVRHRLSQSSEPLDRIEYMIRNRIRIVRLHGSRMDQITFMWYMILGWLPAYAVMRLLKRYGPLNAMRVTLRPLLWNLRDAARRRRWRLSLSDQTTYLEGASGASGR